MKARTLLSALAAALLLAGCYTVPETGRRAFVLPIYNDKEMGAAGFAELKAKGTVSNDPGANARVRRVGERIAKAVGSDLPSAEWEFVVFDDAKEVNAFALPGGKVGVYTGLLRVAETDDELAVVMGHEIGHVTARHGAERMSEAVALAAGGLLLGAALNDNPHRDEWLAAYGVGATVGVMLPYSRLDENEADEIGLVYAAKAGYDPKAGITFWQRMMAESEGKAKLPVFLSTHPANADRIRHIQSLMPKVTPVYEQHRKNY
jgi:predicted Zn-dependent protease